MQKKWQKWGITYNFPRRIDYMLMLDKKYNFDYANNEKVLIGNSRCWDGNKKRRYSTKAC